MLFSFDDELPLFEGLFDDDVKKRTPLDAEWWGLLVEFEPREEGGLLVGLLVLLP